MERHLETITHELRQLRGYERAHGLAAENGKYLSRQLVRPVRTPADHADIGASERSGEVSNDDVVPGGFHGDRNVRGFPPLEQGADLAERRDDHHPDEHNKERE